MIPDFRGSGDRRDLFRDTIGQWFNKVIEQAEHRVAPERYMRPPGALPEVAFLAACTRCGDCISACPTEALTLPPQGWTGYRLAAVELVPERCVTFSGTSCRACADGCPVGSAALEIDAEGHPVLKAEGCVGCGSCIRACITSPSSYTLRPLEG